VASNATHKARTFPALSCQRLLVDCLRRIFPRRFCASMTRTGEIVAPVNERWERSRQLALTTRCA
jgi:hypothetical protein